MSSAAFGLGAHILALAMMAGAAACAIGAATSRSLFAAGLLLMACSALAAASLTALGAGDAGLGVALIGVGVAPVLLSATLLLSVRAAKPRKKGPPWLSITAACASLCALVWSVIDSGGAAVPATESVAGGVAPWLALLVFSAVVTGLGMLGFGERGALERRFEPDA